MTYVKKTSFVIIKNIFIFLLVVTIILNLLSDNPDSNFIFIIVLYLSYFSKKTQIKIFNFEIENKKSSIMRAVFLYGFEVILLVVFLYFINLVLDNTNHLEVMIVIGLSLFFIFFNIRGLWILAATGYDTFVNFHNQFRGSRSINERNNDNLDSFMNVKKKK